MEDISIEILSGSYEEEGVVADATFQQLTDNTSGLSFDFLVGAFPVTMPLRGAPDFCLDAAGNRRGLIFRPPCRRESEKAI